MSRRCVILDCETTSLVPDYGCGTGTIWELCVVEYGAERAEHLWRMKPDLAAASPEALSVGRFYERTADMCATCNHPSSAYDLTRLMPGNDPHWSDPATVAGYVARLLDGATLLIAVPTFDAPYLSAFLAAYGQSRQPWHFRARDIGSMAWAYLHGRDQVTRSFIGEDEQTGRVPRPVPDLDASTDDFARALGVDPDSFERHSALGDCRLIQSMLDVILGSPS